MVILKPFKSLKPTPLNKLKPEAFKGTPTGYFIHLPSLYNAHFRLPFTRAIAIIIA